MTKQLLETSSKHKTLYFFLTLLKRNNLIASVQSKLESVQSWTGCNVGVNPWPFWNLFFETTKLNTRTPSAKSPFNPPVFPTRVHLRVGSFVSPHISPANHCPFTADCFCFLFIGFRKLSNSAETFLSLRILEVETFFVENKMKAFIKDWMLKCYTNLI